MFTFLYGILSGGGGGGLTLPIYSDIIGEDNNIVAYYRLNDTTTAAVDEVSGNSSGTYSGTYSQSYTSLVRPVDIEDYANDAVDFTSGLITLPTDGALDNLAISATNSQGYTIMALVVMDAAGTARQTITGKWEHDTICSGFMFIDANEKLAFRTRLYQGSIYAPEEASATTLVAGKIYHCCIRMGWGANTRTSHKGMQIFLNGKLDMANTIPWTNASSSNDPVNAWNIGRIGGSWPLNGKIDEVAFYNDTLDTIDIEILSNISFGEYDYLVLAYQKGTRPSSFWRFNETSGTIYDFMGVHDLTNLSTGGTYNTTGVPNSLDGSWTGAASNGFRKAGASLITDQSGAFECWIKCTNPVTTNAYIFQMADEVGSDNRIAFYVESGSGHFVRLLREGSGNVTRTYSSVSVTDNNWHYLVAVADGTSAIKLYVDGVESWNTDTQEDGTATDADWFGDVSGSDAITIGYSSFGAIDQAYFDSGTIAQVAIYDTVLTAKEIATKYKSGMGYQGQIDRLEYTGHWMLSDKSGTTADDRSGSHDGTYSNIAELNVVGGTWQQSADFNGTTSYVSVPHHADFSKTTDDILSIAAWIKRDGVGTGSMAIVAKGDTSAATINYQFYMPDNTSLSFYYYQPATTAHIYDATIPDVIDSKWHHVAVVYKYGDADSARLYFDGAEVTGSWTTGTGTPAPYTGTENVYIGCRSTSNNAPFDGWIQHVTISDKYFSDYQIYNLYNEYGLELETPPVFDTTFYAVDFDVDYGSDVAYTELNSKSSGDWVQSASVWAGGGQRWNGVTYAFSVAEGNTSNQWSYYYYKDKIETVDFKISMDYYQDVGDSIYTGIIFLDPDPTNSSLTDHGYGWGLQGGGTRYYQINKINQWNATALSQTTTTDTWSGGTHNLTVIVKQGVIYGYFDGILEEVYDAGFAFKPGYVGMYHYHSFGAHIRNFEVTLLS